MGTCWWWACRGGKKEYRKSESIWQRSCWSFGSSSSLRFRERKRKRRSCDEAECGWRETVRFIGVSFLLRIWIFFWFESLGVLGPLFWRHSRKDVMIPVWGVCLYGVRFVYARQLRHSSRSVFWPDPFLGLTMRIFEPVDHRRPCWYVELKWKLPFWPLI